MAEDVRAPLGELTCNQCINVPKDDRLLYISPSFACGWVMLEDRWQRGGWSQGHRGEPPSPPGLFGPKIHPPQLNSSVPNCRPTVL